jgi:hypothetical protein
MAKLVVKYVTPVGVAVYPKLDTPDVYKDGDTPRYVINVDFGDELPAVKSEIEKLIKEAGFKGKKRPYKDIKGVECLVAKTTRKQPLFDAQNQKLPENIVIGGGSKVKIAIALNSYEGGVNAYLNAVQVISLVEKGSGRDSPFAATDGFQYFGPDDDEPEAGGFPQTEGPEGAETAKANNF